MNIIINQKVKQNSMLYKSWILIIVMSALFSLYYLIAENLSILIISIVIALPSTLVCATTESHVIYIKSLIFNTSITLMICLYPLFHFSQLITFVFLIYCFLDYYLIKKKWNRVFKQPEFTDTLNKKIINRDQFTLDYEIEHGRVWQLKYHISLLVLIIVITIPLIFLARTTKSFFIFIPISLFFSFFLWEYTFKRYLFFHYLFKIYEIKKAL